MPWWIRLILARARPWNASLVLRAAIVGGLVAGFLFGDYRIFRRLFGAATQIEALTPMFAIGLIENFLGLIFLVAGFVLTFSAMTSAIGSFFADLDLEVWHSAPVPRMRILAARWGRTFVQSSYLVLLFLLPVIVALQHELEAGPLFTLAGALSLVMLLAAPVSAASLLILVLVRYFPVRRVHQIAMTLAVLVLTMAVLAVRMARPERLFAKVTTDDVAAVLQAIRLPEAERYPSTWLASSILSFAETPAPSREHLALFLLAALTTGAFFLVGGRIYFKAFVRAKETSAPVAIGAGPVTRLLDRALSRADFQTRAMFGKEARVVTRDAAQWSQLFMMAGLLFLYLYNIQMIPLEGDFRAPLLAWLNLGMAGFIIAAISLRFAYPSVSAEGKQFWILESSPVTIRRVLWTKVAVYLVPLLGVAVLLTAMANLLLAASGTIWFWTVGGSVLITATLVSMGVGMGGFAPDFRRENAMEVALSLGGLAYMALSMLYVGLMMFLIARPIQRFVMRIIFGIDERGPAWLLPLAIAIGTSLLLAIVPVEIAVRRFRRRAIS